MDIVLSGNSPGELWGWVRPFAAAVRKNLPDARISLFLFPCPYATGKEAEVAADLIGIRTVIRPKESLRFLFLGRKPENFSADRPVLIHLGGDLFFAYLLGKRLKAPVYAYQWGERLWDRGMAGYFVPHERQKEVLIRRKIPEGKIATTGDLIVDAVHLEESPDRLPRAVGRYRVALFPGSRIPELRHLLPFYLRIAEVAGERLKEVEFHLVVSPFVEDPEVAGLIESGLKHILESSSGVLLEKSDGKFIRTSSGAEIRMSRGDQYRVMKSSDCVLTIPGTKCGEAGFLGVPMLVTLPTNRLEEIPYPGAPHLLEKIPFVGRFLKRGLLSLLLPKFGFVAQPNILAREEVVPEMVENLTPEAVAQSLVLLLKDERRRENIRKRLKEIYGGLQPGAENMIRIIQSCPR